MSRPEWISAPELSRVRDLHEHIEQDALPEAPLFEGFDEPIVPVATTTGERRRARQAAAVLAGYHPLHVTIAGVLLHPDAPTDVAPGTRGVPLTCGTCVLRVFKHGGAKAYPKCGISGRDSHSDATDVKASWPACTDYQPKETP